MHLSSRTLLFAGMLGIAFSVWAGFQMGSGPHHAALVRTAAEHRHTQPVASEERAVRSQQQPGSLVDAPRSSPPSAENKVVPTAIVSHEPAPTQQVRRRARTVEELPPSYPLVMLELPPAALSDQPELVATMNRLREEFIAKVGGEGQDPNDPAYHARWIQSAPSIDEQLRAAIGWQAYNNLKAAAYLAQKAAP